MPKPFYLIGHNTNTLEQVRNGLAGGLNALEIDINRDANNNLYVNHNFVSANVLVGPQVPLRIAEFLRSLRAIADASPGKLALVILDCKVDDPLLALSLLDAVRSHFSKDGTDQRVLISVPSIDRARRFFPPLLERGLTDHEGLMIDQEPSVVDVQQFFIDEEVKQSGYGNGISTIPIVDVGLPSPRLVSQMDAAVAVSALGGPQFVYPWVLAQQDTMEEHIAIGVTGVMVDISRAGTLVASINTDANKRLLREATVDDNPFTPLDAPVMMVVTADRNHAGTDAIVTFTLKFNDGVFTKRIDSDYVGRFERGQTNCVTLWDCPFQLEALESVSVSHDGTGNAPDWRLEKIYFVDRKSMAPDSARPTFNFNTEITEGQTVTRQRQ